MSYTGNGANESYTGTGAADTITGGFGNDTLNGAGGSDTIYGEASINSLTVMGTDTGAASTQTYVNNTTDTLYIYATYTNGSTIRLQAIPPGGTVTETVYANSARVIGNADSTEFYIVAKTPGAAGSTFTLNTANDSITGGDGNDFLYGQVGNDRIFGGADNDVVEGGTGNDYVEGNDGADSISGGDGADTILGGVGNDVIGGGNENDSILGEAGQDTIRSGSGNDYVSGGTENDVIYGDGGNDSLYGDGGADTIDGSIGNDYISGGDQNDVITGGNNNDILLGDAGNDNISGGGDDDSILGGAQDDHLSGDSGNDTIDGGSENDLVEGGIGNDILSGGTGNDTIYGNDASGAPADDDIIITPGTVTTTNVNTPNLDSPTTNVVAPQNWNTVDLNGVPHVIMTSQAYDGYASIWRLNDDGSLTRTDWMTYQDGNTGTQAVITGSHNNITSSIPPGNLPAFGNAISAVEVVDINGTQTMFMLSRNGSGMSAWTLNNAGQINLAGSIHYGSSQPGLNGGLSADQEVYTGSNGNIYIYATRSQNNYISRVEYNPTTGTFTETPGFHVNTGVTPSGMSNFSVGGNDFLSVANGYGLQVFQINPTNGNLTLTSSVTSTTQYANAGEGDVYTTPDGTVYLVYSNPNAEEFLLYRVGADGSLTQTDSIAGQGDLNRTHSEVNYINGEPILVVSDVTGNMVRLYTISSDGTLVLENEIPWTSPSSSPPIIVQSANGSYYLVDGLGGRTVLLNFSTQGSGDNDVLNGGDGSDVLYGQGGNDTLHGDALADTLDGGTGNDLLDGGTGADLNTGGEGFDTFIAGNGDTISDFNTGTGQNYDDGNQANNDFVDLSGYYNQANLDVYNANALANGQDTYGHALAWMRADQMDDGILNEAGITLTIQNVTDRSQLTYDNTNVVCYGADVLIRTAAGEVPAGKLAVGDLVATQDSGLQPIRWIGRRTLDAATLAAHPKLRPVRIRKGALGAGLPEADLIVSPQHRILVRSRIAQKMFGTAEVLVAAKQLCQLDGIDIAEDLDEVTYVHFLFDAHQIVWANGAESESLLPGPEALRSVGPAAVAEIYAIFPELASPEYSAPAARELVSGRLGRKLAVRHSQNGKPLLM